MSPSILGLYENQYSTIFFLDELPLFAKSTLLLGHLCALALWFWMMADAMSNKKLNKRGIWLFFILVFNWVASVIYFLAVFRKQNRISEQLS